MPQPHARRGRSDRPADRRIVRTCTGKIRTAGHFRQPLADRIHARSYLVSAQRALLRTSDSPVPASCARNMRGGYSRRPTPRSRGAFMHGAQSPPRQYSVERDNGKLFPGPPAREGAGRSARAESSPPISLTPALEKRAWECPRSLSPASVTASRAIRTRRSRFIDHALRDQHVDHRLREALKRRQARMGVTQSGGSAPCKSSTVTICCMPPRMSTSATESFSQGSASSDGHGMMSAGRAVMRWIIVLISTYPQSG